MIKLTQKEFDLLTQIAGFVPTEQKPYFSTSTSNNSIAALKNQGLIDTQQSGIKVEAVILELGQQVLANQVEHEITMGETAHAQTTAQQPAFGAVQQAESLAPAPQQATPTTPANTGGFVIESGVPLPTTVRNYNRSPEYPLAVMEVGQSFFIQATVGADLVKFRRNVSAKVSFTKRNAGLTSDFKTAIDAAANGVRVWRVR